MAVDYEGQASEDPSCIIQALFRAQHASASDNFPRLVGEHFAKLFESDGSLNKIPALGLSRPARFHKDRTLVRFRAMVQDTSLSPEMYLSKLESGDSGGWGIYETQGASSSNASDDVQYANLRECDIVWAVSVPAESQWSAEELDGSSPERSSREGELASPPPAALYKYPHPETEHVGVQVKIYDKDGLDVPKSTDVVTFVGILSAEPCCLDDMQETPPEVPTLHVLFSKPHTSNILLRDFPRAASVANDTQEPSALREELISWIAEESLAGDRHAAEWVLLSAIARVQSRTPPLYPPTLTISQFPPPPPVPSTSSSLSLPLPALSWVLSALLPLAHTLPLSLDSLNKSSFAPESKNEDLHAGVLQLPQGTHLLVSEGGVREGQLVEKGLRNVRALQEVMDSQTLAYTFPFSQYSFPTDITAVVLAEGRKSAFFKTQLSVPLGVPHDPEVVSRLYKSKEQVRMPPPATLAAFRDLVVGARCGKVQVPEATSEHVQAQFVESRRGDRSITADDLIREMSIAKLYALSLHEPTLSVETWQRAKAFDERRKAAVATS
ncbi:mini-chromosome maintenance replisome factor-domain-containing protein [Epithele typhae]|uniref:mini-chromosome maintenance replisome factor-domain-containing protein n=1 Tax=Epithele typhae TaxID=378194 RepID=UPI0020080E84|nr:mini-chromosome maintenance replisome factor-domain-containing protein [Epithele typhae]KAH9946368.1 mini-chromosome maintenance replisome factor-domain-containing protein [Epithele typhae]